MRPNLAPVHHTARSPTRRGSAPTNPPSSPRAGEPGTLTESRLDAIRRMGVKRLGVENLADRVLELNGRAHRSPEIARTSRYARSVGFPEINIDLITGMLGETGRELARLY